MRGSHKLGIEADCLVRKCFDVYDDGYGGRWARCEAKRKERSVPEGDQLADFRHNWSVFWALNTMGMSEEWLGIEYRRMREADKTRLCVYGIIDHFFTNHGIDHETATAADLINPKAKDGFKSPPKITDYEKRLFRRLSGDGRDLYSAIIDMANFYLKLTNWTMDHAQAAAYFLGYIGETVGYPKQEFEVDADVIMGMLREYKSRAFQQLKELRK